MAFILRLAICCLVSCHVVESSRPEDDDSQDDIMSLEEDQMVVNTSQIGSVLFKPPWPVNNSTSSLLHSSIFSSLSRNSKTSYGKEADNNSREYALDSKPVRLSKTIFMFVNFLLLGFFGIDRCVAGSFFLGILKACTLGGFGCWFIVDWALIIGNGILRQADLKMAGFDVEFESPTINDAYTMALSTILTHVSLVLLTFCSCKYNWAGKISEEFEEIRETLPIKVIGFLRSKGMLTEKPTEAEMLAVFAKLDANGDGYLSPEELKQGLLDLGCSLTDTEVSYFMNAGDTNNDGQISKDEFAYVVAALVADQNSAEESRRSSRSSDTSEDALQKPPSSGRSSVRLSLRPDIVYLHDTSDR